MSKEGTDHEDVANLPSRRHLWDAEDDVAILGGVVDPLRGRNELLPVELRLRAEVLVLPHALHGSRELLKGIPHGLTEILEAAVLLEPNLGGGVHGGVDLVRELAILDGAVRNGELGGALSLL